MPRGTFQNSCCQRSCPQGKLLLTHASKGDPPTLASIFGSVFCFFPLHLGPHKILFVPSRSGVCFSKSCWSLVIKFHQTSKSDSLGVLTHLAGSPPWEGWSGAQNFLHIGRTSSVLWSPVCGSPTWFSSVQFSCSVMSNSLKHHELQHTRPPCPSPTHRVHPNPCPSSRWYHPTISSSVVPFSSCLWSFPASGSFPVSQLFESGGENNGASASILPINIQCWFPLGLTGLILQSKGLSRIFSNITVWKHQFFGTQPSLWSNSHHPYMTTRKTIALTIQIL